MGKSSTYYYHPVPGSRELVTRPVGGVERLRKIETAAGDEALEVEFDGERLGRFPGRDSMDSAVLSRELEGLDPLQQLVFLHLVLLSGQRGANFCRVSMNELTKRTGLSRRRLLRTLSELVKMGRIKPLDRDRNGTLYIIYSVLARHIPDREKTKSTPEPKKKKRIKITRKKPIESPINEEIFPAGKKVITIREIAEIFFNETGIKPDDIGMDEAVGQITSLLEDGYTREEVATAVRFLAQNMGKRAVIGKLPYIINQAIEANK